MNSVQPHQYLKSAYRLRLIRNLLRLYKNVLDVQCPFINNMIFNYLQRLNFITEVVFQNPLQYFLRPAFSEIIQKYILFYPFVFNYSVGIDIRNFISFYITSILYYDKCYRNFFTSLIGNADEKSSGCFFKTLSNSTSDTW